jgi:hypothetical protein
LIHLHGNESMLAKAVGRDEKGRISLILYGVALPTAFADPRISCGLYAVVALIWLIPDQRIERLLRGGKS